MMNLVSAAEVKISDLDWMDIIDFELRERMNDCATYILELYESTITSSCVMLGRPALITFCVDAVLVPASVPIPVKLILKRYCSLGIKVALCVPTGTPKFVVTAILFSPLNCCSSLYLLFKLLSSFIYVFMQKGQKNKGYFI